MRLFIDRLEDGAYTLRKKTWLGRKKPIMPGAFPRLGTAMEYAFRYFDDHSRSKHNSLSIDF